MKLKLDIDPDIVAMMAAEVAAGERAVTAAMREAGTGLKTAWITRNGTPLGNVISAELERTNAPQSGDFIPGARVRLPSVARLGASSRWARHRENAAGRAGFRRPRHGPGGGAEPPPTVVAFPRIVGPTHPPRPPSGPTGRSRSRNRRSQLPEAQGGTGRVLPQSAGPRPRRALAASTAIGAAPEHAILPIRAPSAAKPVGARTGGPS
jgi:hypothetical protein